MRQREHDDDGGYTPGNPFDAVIVGYYQGRELLYVWKVRAGFVPHVRREIMAGMKALGTDACPFSNLPEKRRTQWSLNREGMKNCVWLKPALVAQIEFTEWTPDGHLRHPTWSGFVKTKKREVVREPPLLTDLFSRHFLGQSQPSHRRIVEHLPFADRSLSAIHLTPAFHSMQNSFNLFLPMVCATKKTTNSLRTRCGIFGMLVAQITQLVD